MRCSGEELPEGYHEAPSGHDCDDEDAERRVDWSVFPDNDGDGVGAGGRETVCAGTVLPEGYSLQDGDCDDEDSERRMRWSVFPDTDRDGVGAGERETVCTGTELPKGYSLRDDDCDALDTAAWQVLAYSHRDADEDGFTVPESGTRCSGARPVLP